jgi:hypothetical protein
LRAAEAGGWQPGFVVAAPNELPRGLRINCVSPTVLAESTDYYQFFPDYRADSKASQDQLLTDSVA